MICLVYVMLFTQVCINAYSTAVLVVYPESTVLV